MAHKSPELSEEFLVNAETQRNLTRNGQHLLATLNFFVSSVNTIVNKTMEDTMVTVKQYEVARVEYDAYRYGQITSHTFLKPLMVISDRIHL